MPDTALRKCLPDESKVSLIGTAPSGKGTTAAAQLSSPAPQQFARY
jgi:hypothetical protein